MGVLVGGVKGRRAEELHNKFAVALEQARNGGEQMCGAAIDLSKCFDTVNPQLAIHVLEKIEWPRKVQCLFKAHGTVAEWCKRVHAIVRGCAWNVLLLEAIMTLWSKALEDETPSVEHNIFVDDRLLWTSDERELSKALEISYEFDEMCGLTWNAKKGALLAMDDARDNG